MSFVEFKDWVFLGVLSGGVWILWEMKNTMTKMNEKLLVIITEHKQTKEAVKDHEVRLRKANL